MHHGPIMAFNRKRSTDPGIRTARVRPHVICRRHERFRIILDPSARTGPIVGFMAPEPFVTSVCCTAYGRGGGPSMSVRKKARRVEGRHQVAMRAHQVAVVSQVLLETRGSVSEAARVLGLSGRTVFYMIRELRIDLAAIRRKAGV